MQKVHVLLQPTLMDTHAAYALIRRVGSVEAVSYTHLDVYKRQLQALVVPPPAPEHTPGERVFEWRPVSALAGKRFKTEEEVDQALDTVARDLKAQIREGFTVVVKGL